MYQRSSVLETHRETWTELRRERMLDQRSVGKFSSHLVEYEGGREKRRRDVSRSFCQGDNYQAFTQVSTVFSSMKHCCGQEWGIIARKRTIRQRERVH